MADSVYNVVELIGTSTDSWEQAAANAVREAARAHSDLRVAEVIEQDVLIEDGPVNRRIFATMLERAGADVDIAVDGQEGLDHMDSAAADGWSYDLIISDMQMPKMDGYTFARTLRDRGDQTPIIALTAHAMAEDRDRCISAGCDDFVVKPITRRGLVSACAYWLRGPGSEAA